jgi:hypothetical protein
MQLVCEWLLLRQSTGSALVHWVLEPLQSQTHKVGMVDVSTHSLWIFGILRIVDLRAQNEFLAFCGLWICERKIVAAAKRTFIPSCCLAFENFYTTDINWFIVPVGELSTRSLVRRLPSTFPLKIPQVYSQQAVREYPTLPINPPQR